MCVCRWFSMTVEMRQNESLQYFGVTPKTLERVMAHRTQTTKQQQANGTKNKNVQQIRKLCANKL